MKGANREKEKEHKPVIMNSEWCVERSISTPNSCEAAKEAGEVAHGGQICAVRAEGGLKAVTFERIKSDMNEDGRPQESIT